MTQIQISITIDIDDLIFLKRKGMSRSKFMRQALQAFKKGKWDYDFLK